MSRRLRFFLYGAPTGEQDLPGATGFSVPSVILIAASPEVRTEVKWDMRPSQGTLPSMRDNPVAPVPTCVDPRIRITLKIVNERKATLQLSLGETSTMLGLSEAHLLRLFHREVGKTFRRYLRDVRMIQAAELVKQNDLPIKQIALDCGYTDVSNFYRDFKAIHRTTPRKARLHELTEMVTAYGGNGDSQSR
jgi:AraC-like DNA-binding protein